MAELEPTETAKHTSATPLRYKSANSVIHQHRQRFYRIPFDSRYRVSTFPDYFHEQ